MVGGEPAAAPARARRSVQARSWANPSPTTSRTVSTTDSARRLLGEPPTQQRWPEPASLRRLCFESKRLELPCVHVPHEIGAGGRKPHGPLGLRRAAVEARKVYRVDAERPCYARPLLTESLEADDPVERKARTSIQEPVVHRTHETATGEAGHEAVQVRWWTRSPQTRVLRMTEQVRVHGSKAPPRSSNDGELVVLRPLSLVRGSHVLRVLRARDPPLHLPRHGDVRQPGA